MSERDDGRLRTLRKLATDRPVDVLIGHARAMHAEGLLSRSVQEVVNASVLVEFAAELRPPADVARLVTEFAAGDAPSDLARLALDAAAARRSVIALDTLVGILADRGYPEQAGRLLDAVVHRRMPRDIAELLHTLLEIGRTMLIERLSDDRTPDECRVLVVFWLRAHGKNELARQTALRMAEHLGPNALTGLVRGLLAQQDTESADAAIEYVIGRDPGELARLVLELRANGPYATYVLDEALTRLDPGGLLALASLLEAGAYTEGARRIWDAVIPGMPARVLIGTLIECAERTGDLAAATEPLRIAARTYPIQPSPHDERHCVAELAIEVKGRIRDGEIVVLRTAAAVYPVAEVFGLAGQLGRRGRGDLSRLLLNEAAGLAHERADSGQVAAFIDLLLERASEGDRTARRGWRRPKRHVPSDVSRILDDMAAERNPERLMGLIAGLERLPENSHGHSRYLDLHEEVEAAVATRYTGAELARLPLVRRRDHLLAVMEIEKKALETSRANVGVEHFPDVLDALINAGAEEGNLRRFLSHIGAMNRDRSRIAQAFRDRDFPVAADYVINGPKNLPLYVVRFYPPDDGLQVGRVEGLQGLPVAFGLGLVVGAVIGDAPAVVGLVGLQGVLNAGLGQR